MTEITSRQRVDHFATVRVLVVLEAVIFLFAALQHLGLSIPLGFALLTEPRILPAAIVEGSSGLLFIFCAFALFSGADWARPVLLFTHLYALAGVLLGIFSLALGFGPRTSTNDVYHMVMLLLITPSLALLLSGNSLAGEGTAAGFFHWLIRITGLVQIFLGGLFWIIQNDYLVPFHILVGSLLVIALWALAFLAAQAGVDRKWVTLAAAWGLVVVALGLTQAQLLPGPFHWLIQLLHLFVGLGAMGQGEGLTARIRQVEG